MVLTSAQIAEMNGAFQSQNMAQMQHAAMLGTPQYGYAGAAEGIVGGTMNRGAAIGNPLVMGGLAVAGLDPVSAGLRAGLGASRMGAGMMGAGAAGLGAAAGIAVPLMAAQYAGGQIMQGAQGQQQLNSMMRTNFQFANQYGGTGFTRGGLGEIGTTMRQMTTEQGPMGEMVGFEELGRLAANMGRMGMAQGVRDAKEFSEKFKTMVKSLKEIATEMGTSLEEAQKMMGSMRGSGVFGGNKATQFARDIRAGARAGGMATSELTGMMNIGSQISRSVGGLGGAGARGGLETITNIGVAQQMGILSEEDVYNATGLTGAEGRRALATQQMSQSARFLKGGLGRRFLAAIAGEGGTLDEGSVEEFMAGGVGTGRTMQMAHRNLAKVGRADFIRNEGRLRGAALEKFGGLAPAMVMKGWLQQRGIDVDEDQDRAMIFLQRRLHMGRDEADLAVRQVKALPQIMRERQIAGREDEFARGVAQQRSGTGIEGLKRKFEDARSEVQAGLQQVGASFYQDMSESVERFINGLTDNYVKEYRRDVSRLLEQSRQGGATGASAFDRAFGMGGVSPSLVRGADSATRFGGLDLLQGVGSGLTDFGQSQMTQMGHGALTAGKSGRALQGALKRIDAVTGAFQAGGVGVAGREELLGFGGEARGDIRGLFTSGRVKGRGMERFARLETELIRKSRAGGHKGALGNIARRLSEAKTEEERAQILATVTQAAGVEGEEEMFQAPGDVMGLFTGGGQFRTSGERQEAIGERLFGLQRGKSADAIQGAIGKAADYVKGLFGGKAGPGIITRQAAGAAGRYFESEAGRDVLARITSADADTRDQARTSLENELVKLGRKEGDLTDPERGRQAAMRSMLLAQERMELFNDPDLTDEERDQRLRARAKELGVEGMDAERMADLALTARYADIKGAQRQAVVATQRQARRQVSIMQKRGLLVRGEGGKLTLSSAGLKAAGAAKDFVESMARREELLAGGGAGSEAHKRADQEVAMHRELLSVEQKRQVASNLRDELRPEERQDLLRQAGIQQRLGRAGGVGARQKAIAKALGVDLDAEDLKASPEELSKIIAGKAGVEGPEAIKELQTALSAVKGKGGLGRAAGSLDRLMGPGSAFMEQMKKQQLQAAEREDPLGVKRNEALDKIAKATEKTVTAVNNLSGKIDEKFKNAEDEG